MINENIPDILVRIEESSQFCDSWIDLRCRLTDCANEIIALRAELTKARADNESERNKQLFLQACQTLAKCGELLGIPEDETTGEPFELYYAIKQLTEKARSQWIDCSVEFPKDGSTILAFGRNSAMPYQEKIIMPVRVNKLRGSWTACQSPYNYPFIFTHWQNLPLPPNAQQEPSLKG